MKRILSYTLVVLVIVFLVSISTIGCSLNNKAKAEETAKEATAITEKIEIEGLPELNESIEKLIALIEEPDVAETTATETIQVEENKDEEVVKETGEILWGWKTEWYQSPFRDTTDQLKDKLTWETLAEPGVLSGMNDTQTAWDKMDGKDTPMLTPEGGYLYFAIGSYNLWLEEPGLNPNPEKRVFLFEAPAVEERIYLTIVRGLPADNEDPDFNRTVIATDYVRGAGINHVLPIGAYVSLGWFLQQVDNAFEPQEGLESPNCGDNGCEEVYVVLIDIKTQTVRVWVIGPELRDWTQVNSI